MYVLVMGKRQGILKALKSLGVDYSIWPETGDQAITHIIAGTEKSVIPASQLRRELNARINPLTEVEKCADKLIMKRFLAQHSIAMTDFLPGHCDLKGKTILERLGTPVIAKPRKSSGGRGLTRVTNEADLKIYQNEDFIFEKQIKGTEGSVESFIKDQKVTFENITRYVHPGEANILPGDYSEDIKNQILNLNRKVISAMGIRWGMTHLEFYITQDKVLFGEIAIRPPGGYIMELIKKVYDFDPWQAFVNLELDIPSDFKMKPNGFAASLVIPRREGIVQSVSGLEAAEALPTLARLKIRVKPGDTLQKREGVSDSCGHALFYGENKAHVLADLEAARQIIQIKIK
ncbi:MAG: ATP-grasp domain-containing protein [Bdellovibrionales bacterium]|nr:ATP-grasp domain-containing protein [Bdellovibrionales bacterium]